LPSRSWCATVRRRWDHVRWLQKALSRSADYLPAMAFSLLTPSQAGYHDERTAISDYVWELLRHPEGRRSLPLRLFLWGGSLNNAEADTDSAAREGGGGTQAVRHVPRQPCPECGHAVEDCAQYCSECGRCVGPMHEVSRAYYTFDTSPLRELVGRCGSRGRLILQSFDRQPDTPEFLFGRMNADVKNNLASSRPGVVFGRGGLDALPAPAQLAS
jgi:hypothetical protein